MQFLRAVSTLKIDAAASSMTLTPIYQTTQLNIPEDHNGADRILRACILPLSATYKRRWCFKHWDLFLPSGESH
jgi:hypothetical protein